MDRTHSKRYLQGLKPAEKQAFIAAAEAPTRQESIFPQPVLPRIEKYRAIQLPRKAEPLRYLRISLYAV
jgi:hypothetical protein